MALDPVVKVELTAHKTVLEKLLVELQSAGLLHVDPHSIKQWESEKAESDATGKTIAGLKKEIHDVERSLGFLQKYEPKIPFLKKISMQPDEVTRDGLKEVAEKKSAQSLKEQCAGIEQQLAGIQNDTRDILQKKEELLPLAGFGAPLNLLAAGGKTRAFVSRLEKEFYENLEKVDLPGLVCIERISGDTTVFFSVVYHLEAQEFVDQLERDFHFDPLSYPAAPDAPRKLIEEYHMFPEFAWPLLNLTAVAMPWVEVLCGVMLILGIGVRGAAGLLLALLLVFTTMIIIRGLRIYHAGAVPAFCAIKFNCGCGGGDVLICHKIPENLTLILLAVIALLSKTKRFCLARNIIPGSKAP